LAASISVEAVTPPLVGWAFKELLLFCGIGAGKSTADGTISGYWFSALSAGVLALGFRSGSSWSIVILARDETCRYQLTSCLRLLSRICQQIVKFMSFYIPKYVINLISGYSLGV
jgi:hypothetical protein